MVQYVEVNMLKLKWDGMYCEYIINVSSVPHCQRDLGGFLKCSTKECLPYKDTNIHDNTIINAQLSALTSHGYVLRFL